MKRELNEIQFMNYTIKQPYNMVVTIHFQGNLTKSQLEKGFQALQSRHILLGVQIGINEKNLPYFTSEGVGSIPIIEIPRRDDHHALEILEKEMNYIYPMGVDIHDPLFRVILLKGNDENDLIFNSQHCIADGLSMALILRDLLLSIYVPNLEQPEVSEIVQKSSVLPVKFQKRLPKNPLKFRFLFLFVRLFHGIRFRQKHKKRSSKDDSSEEISPKSMSPYNVHAWTIDPAQTLGLLDKCHKEHVSLHSALCTAFLPTFPVINSPVNLRQRLITNANDAVGLFAGGAVVNLKYKSTQSFWDNARHFHTNLRKKMSDKNVFWIFNLFSKVVPIGEIQRFGAMFVDLVSNMKAFAITNLGSLDNLGLDSSKIGLKIKGLNGGVSSTIDAITLVVFTLQGRLSFQLNYRDSQMNSDDAKKLSDEAMLRILSN